MAPETTVVSAVAVAVPPAQVEAWEIRLVKTVTSKLSQEFPQKPQHRVINELLTGLLEEHQAREARNLNHWPEYGPKFLTRLAVKWKADEANRLKRIAVFLKEYHKNAVRLALAVTDNLPDAEATVSETDLDLLSGAVKEESYLLAVKRDALDLVRRRQVEQGKYLPLEEAFETAGDEREDSMEGVAGAERLDCEPAGTNCDTQDPLDVLIQREDAADRGRELQEAKQIAITDWRYRWLKQKKWARELGLWETQECTNVTKCLADSITK